MRNLKFVDAKPGRARELDVDSLVTLGIELSEGLRWDESNDHTVAVSNANADILLAKLPGDFIEVTSEEVAEAEVQEDEQEEKESEDETPNPDIERLDKPEEISAEETIEEKPKGRSKRK